MGEAMRQTFITATIVGMLGAHSLDAQDSNNNSNSAQVTETDKKPPEIEARPQERDITAMAVIFIKRYAQVVICQLAQGLSEPENILR